MFNDPSAGSPTDALLRLLFPLNNYIRISLMINCFIYLLYYFIYTYYPLYSYRNSLVRATGGVYKGQGHILLSFLYSK